MDGDIQYVADTFLLERTFQILAAADASDGPLRKYAFDLGSVLSSIGNSIKTFVGGQIHGQDSGGVARTVVNFLAPAVFFRLHPILGILVTAGQLFGFDLYAIFESIVGAILPKIRSGQPVSAQEVNQAGQSAMAGAGGGTPMAAAASDDLLHPLRELHQNKLLKEAVGYKSTGYGGAWSQQPFMPQNTNPLLRMFSFLAPAKRGSLIVGILVWFVKTVLMSAGLLAVGGMAAGALGLTSGPQAGSPTATAPGTGGAPPATVGLPAGIPAPTGAGSYNFRPNPSDIWVESLGGQQPHERVLAWTIESYPNLDQYTDIILRTPSFWNAVRGISQQWAPGQEQLVIPKPYKTRQEIINLFINDVWRQVQQRGLR
jgi:hypothetical protein